MKFDSGHLWKFVIKRVARSYGFMDPVRFLFRLSQFAQPSEIGQPLELLRAGAIFHARGVINSHAIQNNLDWIWPFWAERQFNPHDNAFLPRGFAISNVNLTHRNWTAIGLPGFEQYPIVDPAGLLTPFWDGWSIDAWVVTQSCDLIIPSRKSDPCQMISFEDGIRVDTCFDQNVAALSMASQMIDNPELSVQMTVAAKTSKKAILVITIRPYNPEGISFIDDIDLTNNSTIWRINKKNRINFSVAPRQFILSNYSKGDVYARLRNDDYKSTPRPMRISCKTGLATGAAIYPLVPEKEFRITVKVPYPEKIKRLPSSAFKGSWDDALNGTAILKVPDTQFVFLFNAAMRTIVLLSPCEVFPGPYTYKRFWFRDAVFILNALISLNRIQEAGKIIARFPKKQRWDGYFLSQEGEWDANGQVLWLIGKYYRISGKRPDREMCRAIQKAAQWIIKKRLFGGDTSLHDGLLPAGFSAEHFGPNDYYYWDDFWAEAGLREAAHVLKNNGYRNQAKRCRDAAEDFRNAIWKSIKMSKTYQRQGTIPASPYRRMDSGAIGSIVCSYPLKLLSPGDMPVFNTVDYLYTNCLVDGSFFQDMIHSGKNAYLSLHLAQVFLRYGDKRFMPLIQAVADMASSTGQWPEAVHPKTAGGCMGDGQHAWAAAEWIVMMRNLFIREEEGTLVLLSGIPEEWLKSGDTLKYGPTPSTFGIITVETSMKKGKLLIDLYSDKHLETDRIILRLPTGDRNSVAFQPLNDYHLKGEVTL